MQTAMTRRKLSVLAFCIFMLATLVRIPSCGESLWIDELHSVWCVWGSVGDVAERAIAGNQTPFYFWGLWFWKLCGGDSEWSLRLPSVLASSAAAAIVAIGVAMSSRCRIAGVAAGSMLALESHAIFFGTEVRPFAAVMLMSAIACWSMSLVELSRQWRWTWLIGSTLVAASIQPMSIGAFAWLIAIALVSETKFAKSIAIHWVGSPRILLVAVALILIPTIYFGSRVLMTAWRYRAQWQTVGDAVTWQDVWRIWPWTAFLVVPLGLATISLAAGGKREGLWRYRMAFAAIMITITYWLVAVSGIAPVFHRRYLAACLPMLAWAAGDAIGVCVRAIRDHAAWRHREWFAVTIAMIPIAWVFWPHLAHLGSATSDVALVRRGEDWRGASQFLGSHFDGRPVRLLPGLIETNRLLDSTGEAATDAQAYLSFPFRGPYRVNDVTVIAMSRIDAEDDSPIVVRGRRQLANQIATLIRTQTRRQIAIHSFGRVHVIANDPGLATIP